MTFYDNLWVPNLLYRTWLTHSTTLQYTLPSSIYNASEDCLASFHTYHLSLKIVLVGWGAKIPQYFCSIKHHVKFCTKQVLFTLSNLQLHFSSKIVKGALWLLYFSLAPWRNHSDPLYFDRMCISALRTTLGKYQDHLILFGISWHLLAPPAFGQNTLETFGIHGLLLESIQHCLGTVYLCS